MINKNETTTGFDRPDCRKNASSPCMPLAEQVGRVQIGGVIHEKTDQ
ncbi:MAG: hypothetical protein WC296_05965 [Candidatus Izemoplasmatales bacterium]